MGKDPFRPAERATPCPKCDDVLLWNVEDRLGGQSCIGCGYTFHGRERRTIREPFATGKSFAEVCQDIAEGNEIDE